MVHWRIDVEGLGSLFYLDICTIIKQNICTLGDIHLLAKGPSKVLYAMETLRYTCVRFCGWTGQLPHHLHAGKVGSISNLNRPVQT